MIIIIILINACVYLQIYISIKDTNVYMFITLLPVLYTKMNV